jgi:hypothetical protein
MIKNFILPMILWYIIWELVGYCGKTHNTILFGFVIYFSYLMSMSWFPVFQVPKKESVDDEEL